MFALIRRFAAYGVVLFVCVSMPSSSFALAANQPFTAKVIAITDGDTIRVLTISKTMIKVRLGEIDAPESGQAYGSAAKRELSRLIYGKTVVVMPSGVDRYGRMIARLRVGGVDVATEMVRRGAAWVFVSYSHDTSLPPIEAQARSARIGLWALPADQRQPPWDWRAGRRAGAHAILPSFPSLRLPFTSKAPAKDSGPSCSAKRFCSQMSSCDEAVYHLRVCGQRRLDGDGDGKPCERLCG